MSIATIREPTRGYCNRSLYRSRLIGLALRLRSETVLSRSLLENYLQRIRLPHRLVDIVTGGSPIDANQPKDFKSQAANSRHLIESSSPRNLRFTCDRYPSRQSSFLFFRFTYKRRVAMDRMLSHAKRRHPLARIFGLCVAIVLFYFSLA